MVFQYIDTTTFIVSLGIGVLIAYIIAPNPKVIYKYPTPKNAGKVTYLDDSGVCYKYKSVQVDCPADESKIKKIE